MSDILIVEDSQTIRTMMANLLESEGHTVSGARDGLSAMTMLRDKKPDMILLDIMLPGVGGIELCMVIRRNPELKDVPIVMVTGIRTQANLANRAGADAYLVKPYSDEQLMSTVNWYLMAGRTRQPMPVTADIKQKSWAVA